MLDDAPTVDRPHACSTNSMRRADAAGQQVVRAGRRAAQAARRLFDPVRQPRARRLRAQAGRSRHAAPSRARPACSKARKHAFAAVQSDADPRRRRAGDPQRRPGRRPGHARDAGGDRRAGGPRPGQRRRPDHRRPLQRRHPRLHGRPYRAGSGARRPDRAVARGRPHHHRCRHRAASTPMPISRRAAPAWITPRRPRSPAACWPSTHAWSVRPSKGAVTDAL